MSTLNLWSPSHVLEIADRRCVGYAKTTKRKCRNVISGYNLIKADSILDELAQNEPDATALRRKLHQLAEHLLCVRWHQNQARDMVIKWVERIESAFPHSEEVRLPSSRHTSIAESPASSRSSRSRTANRVPSVTLSVSPSTNSVQNREEVYQRNSGRPMRRDARPIGGIHRRSYDLGNSTSSTFTTASASRSIVSVPQTPRLSTVFPASSTGDALPRRPSPTVPSPTNTLPRAQASNASLPRPTQVQAPISLSSPAASVIGSQTQSATSSPDPIPDVVGQTPTATGVASHSHVQQRPIDDECPICKDEFLDQDRIVWCKAACGRSVHERCFDAWQMQCVSMNKNATCAICRAGWEDQNASTIRIPPTSCTRTHVRRLDADDECPVCFEHYKPEDELVWCKDGCGRTVHQECFNEWRTHLQNNESSVRCTFCRTVWVSDCDCDA